MNTKSKASERDQEKVDELKGKIFIPGSNLHTVLAEPYNKQHFSSTMAWEVLTKAHKIMLRHRPVPSTDPEHIFMPMFVSEFLDEHSNDILHHKAVDISDVLDPRMWAARSVLEHTIVWKNPGLNVYTEMEKGNSGNTKDIADRAETDSDYLLSQGIAGSGKSTPRTQLNHIVFNDRSALLLVTLSSTHNTIGATEVLVGSFAGLSTFLRDFLQDTDESMMQAVLGEAIESMIASFYDMLSSLEKASEQYENPDEVYPFVHSEETKTRLADLSYAALMFSQELYTLGKDICEDEIFSEVIVFYLAQMVSQTRDEAQTFMDETAEDKTVH